MRLLVSAALLCLCLTFPSLAQQMLSGNTSGSAPASSVGAEGQFFLDLSSGSVFGPKTSGLWPATGTPPAIRGSIAGAAPCTGCIGEEIESSIPVGSAVATTSTVSLNVTSVALTAGNWLCYGQVDTIPAGGTTTSIIQAGLNTTSATLPTAPNDGAANLSQFGASLPAGSSIQQAIGQRIYRTATPITVYLVANVTFAVSTLSTYGYLGCFRQP